MTDIQPRVSEGKPGAGRWKSPEHPESHVQLFDRMDGSFFHPAPFKTAERCIEFWSTVEIPDQIIDQFAEAYYEAQSAEVDDLMDARMEQWQRTWFAANPQPKDRLLQAWEEKYQAEREAYRLSILPGVEAEINDRRPPALGEYDLPQFVRAAQMWRHAPNPERFPEEEKEVGNHLIELYDGFMTVNEIQEKYDFRRFKSSLDRVYPDDSTDRIVAALGVLDDGNLAIQQDIILNRQMNQF